MKKLFLSLDRYRSQLSLAFLLLSVIVILFNLFSLLPVDELLYVRDYFEVNLNLFMAVLFCSYIVYSVCGKFDKSLCATTSLLVADMVCFAVTELHFSPVLILFLIFVLTKIYEKLELIYAFCISLFFCVTVSLIIGLTQPIFYEFLKQFALFLSEKPSLFNVVNNIFVLFFSTQLEDIIFNTGIGASMVINDTAVTGVKGVFEATVDNPNQMTSQFLTGKYFVNIFVAIGAFLNVFSKLNIKQKATLSLVTIVSVVFGNNILLSLYLLLLNPISYVGYLMLIFVCNIVSTLLDLRIGYLQNGNIIELFDYANNMIYFIIAGFIICILSYFVFRIIFAQFDSDNEILLSKDAKRIFSALGGKKNIESIEDNCVFVRNANLINILKLDCEIYSNKVILLEDDMQILKDNY